MRSGRGRVAIESPVVPILILLLYLAFGAEYARLTPLWQVPDEPAHYNYIAQLVAAPARLPVIEPGDYPYARLEALKASRFGVDAAIEGIEYEDHQPPAYYLLASIVYRASAGGLVTRVLAIRLLGVFLGALTVALAWRLGRRLEPGRPIIALGTASFVAFLPMRLSMVAAVNNDPLAYAVVAMALLLSVERLGGRVSDRGMILGGGLLLGLAALTKVTVLAPACGVILLAELLRARRKKGGGQVGSDGSASRAGSGCFGEPDRSGNLGGSLGSDGSVSSLGSSASRPFRLADLGVAPAMLALGSLLSAPWALRNMRVYGAGDPFALRAHARVTACLGVEGCQARTADWIAAEGLPSLLGRMLRFTFDSFWGVFGWMGVFFDRIAGLPIYPALALLSLAATFGLGLYLRRRLKEAAPGSGPLAPLVLLGLALGLTLAGFLAYNLNFVQHQGRYLFPALLPIAFGFSAGLAELAGGFAGVLGLSNRSAGRLAGLILLGFAAALQGLAWIGLHRYILPGLG
jgi:hypothetical protein